MTRTNNEYRLSLVFGKQLRESRWQTWGQYLHIYFPTYQAIHKHSKLYHMIMVNLKKKKSLEIMFCRIFHLLLGGRRSYFREEESPKGCFFKTKGIFLPYVFCCLFLLFLLALLVPGRHHSTLSGYGGRWTAVMPEKMPGSVVGQESAAPPRSSSHPVGIKPLGADARRGPLTPSAGVTSMLLHNPHGHL